MPSFDLTAGDRSLKVSENDYGITAVQEACQCQARPRPGGQASPPTAAARLRHPPGTPHRGVIIVTPPFKSKQTPVTQSNGAAPARCPGRSHVPAEGWPGAGG